MNFITFIRPYMNFFYLFGQTLYPFDYYLCGSSEKRFFLMFPTIISFVLKLALCVASFVSVNVHGESKNNTSRIVFGILLFCEVVKVIAVIHQNIAYQAVVGEILRGFQTIELQFQRTLHRPIGFDSFKRVHSAKIYRAIVSYVMLLISFVIYWIVNNKFKSSEVMIKVMLLIGVSLYMHATLFIDLITFNLNHLNTIVEKDISDSDWARTADKANVKKADMIGEQLVKYRFIHFLLWKNTELVNKSFGWTLLTMLLHSFAEFVHIAIWQFKVLDDIWNVTRLTRMKHGFETTYNLKLSTSIFPFRTTVQFRSSRSLRHSIFQFLLQLRGAGKI